MLKKKKDYRLNIKEMKKLVLFAAIVAAVSFASCSNKAQTEAAPEEAAVETVQEAPESPAQETATEEAPADSAATETPAAE